jgi:tetratricopeptide (TPR) repeat protein
MTTPDTLPRLDFDKIRYRQLLADGIAAVKSGDLEQARVLLEKAASLSPLDARPWLWLSGATENPMEQRACLENALAADPNNSSAQLGLRLLSEKTDRQRVMGGKEQLPVRNSPQPIPAEAAQLHLCTKCGGHLCFDLETRQLRCEVCGDPKPVNIIPVTGHVEQVLDTTLVTPARFPLD